MLQRTFISLAVLLLFAAGLLYAGLVVDFSAQSAGDNVKLYWRTEDESGLDHFDINRASGASGSFQMINPQPITAHGVPSEYTYIDKSVFKPADGFFRYQLIDVKRDGSREWLDPISLSHSVSGVKRTWGSIKAMFR